MKKTLLFISVLTISSLTGCKSNSTPTTDDTTPFTPITLTDMLGREVHIDKKVDKVVCIGAGALRLYSYVGDTSKLCGIEDVERQRVNSVSLRPYQLANEYIFKSLPSCGLGGPANQTPEPEKIIECDPDLIVSLYTSSAEDMDTLSRQTGKPVLTLSYGANDPFAERVMNSITLLGKALGREERAAEVNGYLTSYKEDLYNRTKDIKEEDKPSAYLACNSFYGVHGFTSTCASYSVFNATNIKNAAANLVDKVTPAMVDINLEDLLIEDPDYIFIDCGGLSTLKTEYAVPANKTKYDTLTAFKNGKVYLQMPFNAYYTNIELAICTAYFDASVVYPEQFDDIVLPMKYDEILTNFVGKNVYPDICNEMYGGYIRITDVNAFLTK